MKSHLKSTVKSNTICLKFQRRRSKLQTHCRVCLDRVGMQFSSVLVIVLGQAIDNVSFSLVRQYSGNFKIFY